MIEFRNIPESVFMRLAPTFKVVCAGFMLGMIPAAAVAADTVKLVQFPLSYAFAMPCRRHMVSDSLRLPRLQATLRRQSFPRRYQIYLNTTEALHRKVLLRCFYQAPDAHWGRSYSTDHSRLRHTGSCPPPAWSDPNHRAR